MKKHILINLLIKTLLFGFVFAYVSCSEELYNHEHDEHKRTKKVNLSELPMLQNTINQRKANMRGAEDSLAVYLTLINPENILMVDAPDGSKHYTFSLQINQEEKLTNLVIKEKEEQYDYNLVKYTSDNYQQWITDIKDVGYSTILPNVDVTEFNKFHEVCFIYKWECPWGIHDLSNVFACEETNLKYWTVTAVQVPCVGETSGGGGSSSGSSGGSSGSSSTGGSSYGGSSGNNYTVITSPTPCNRCPEVENPDEINEPCDDIKNATSSPEYKQRFKNLNTPTNINSNVEIGFVEKEVNGQNEYVYLQASGQSELTIPPGSKNYTHVHNNKPKISENGIPYDGRVKIHSPQDILTLLNTCQTSNGTDIGNTFGIMISDEGIFSLNLIEPVVMDGHFWDEYFAFVKDYKIRSKSIIEDVLLNTNQRKTQLQKLILKGLKKMELLNKIALFEGTVENENSTDMNLYNIKWERKFLSNNIFNPIETIPCN